MIKGCAWCDKELHQRDEETDLNWDKRKTCGRVCASKLREFDKRDGAPAKSTGKSVRGDYSPWGWGV